MKKFLVSGFLAVSLLTTTTFLNSCSTTSSNTPIIIKPSTDRQKIVTAEYTVKSLEAITFSLAKAGKITKQQASMIYDTLLTIANELLVIQNLIINNQPITNLNIIVNSMTSELSLLEKYINSNGTTAFPQYTPVQPIIVPLSNSTNSTNSTAVSK